MIDIHCHILPQVDDGAKDETVTLKMIEQSAHQGINCIVATPHFRHDASKDYLRRVVESYRAMSGIIEKTGAEIKFYLGGEIMYSSLALEMLEEGKFPTINNTDYVLVEFPPYIQFKELKAAIHDLTSSGYIPIIAHVERYQFIGDLKKIYVLEKIGAYCQMNTSILLGDYGFMKKRFALKLIKNNLVHFVASDGHNDSKRKINLKAAYNVVAKKFDLDTANKLFRENQERVIRGERLGV